MWDEICTKRFKIRGEPKLKLDINAGKFIRLTESQPEKKAVYRILIQMLPVVIAKF